MPRFLMTFLSILIVTLVSSAGFAQDERAAQQFFEEGAAAYFKGEYADALVQFKKAHSTVPNALFLYNIALCNVKLGRYREGLVAAQKAREMGGLEEKQATQNDARIASLRRVEHAVATSVAMEASIRHDDVQVSEPVASLQAETETESREGFGTIGWIGVGTAVVGVGFLGGALATELAIQPKWEEYKSAAEQNDPETYDARRAEIEGLQQTGKILLYSGAGLTVVGVALIVVDIAKRPAESGEVALRVGPSRVDFVVRF